MDPVETRVRIEILEELVRLVQSSAGSSFAGPIVANEAAASALAGLVDGEQVFVLSHRSIWTKRVGVAGTQGTATQGSLTVPPLKAHEVIASAAPVGVLTRTNYSDPSLRIGVDSIFIDPANVNANDENTGATATAPLQTGQELYRRWGWGSLVTVGPNLATSVDGFVEIKVNSDILAPDSLEWITQTAIDGSLRVRGGVAATLRTSTITAGPTAMNRAAPAPGGTRLRLTDAALATWAIFLVANIRGRFTNGPAINGTFQPQVAVAAGIADCSGCQTTNEPGFSTVPTTVTPANGNAYVIEQLITVNFGAAFENWTEQNPSFGGFNVFINVVDCHIPSMGLQLDWQPRLPNGALLNFYQCTFNRPWRANGSTTNLVACYFTEGFTTAGANDVRTSGGGALVLAGSLQVFFNFGANGGLVSSDFVSNGMNFFCNGEVIGNTAAWNVAITGGNPSGHGILIGGIRSEVNFPSLVWGNGNVGVGLKVNSAADGIGPPQNITGVNGDFLLASSAVGWWWNTATGVYNPIGAGIALTWAAVIAAKGAAGFGGVAHNPDQDSHWIAA